MGLTEATEGEVRAMDREDYSAAVGVELSVTDSCFPEDVAVKHDSFDGDAAARERREDALPRAVAGEGQSAEMTLGQVIEALLFASDTPLSGARVAELAGAGSAREVRRQVDALNEKYAECGLSFRIEAVARGYQMMTQPAYEKWLVKLHQERSQTRLTPAALETLSIVAYKQPVIRADVEAIRGVACGEVLNRLREMGLVRIVGRAEIVGRPMLYGTTKRFLQVFGLEDLDDLPPMEALKFGRSQAQAAEEDVGPNREAAQDAGPQVAAAGA